MDPFVSVYNQILNKQSKQYNNLCIDLIKHLTDIILNHLDYFVDKTQYQKYLYFAKLRASNLDQELSLEQIKNQIKELYKVQCLNPITLQFQTLDLQTNDAQIFFIVPQSLIRIYKR